jgi:ABC-type multidrug transport system fused ATPase/permease subunit
LEQPELTCRDQADLLKPAKIRIDNATFRWGDENDTDSNCFTLSDINLNIPNPSLTIVLGAVATGKSTLASAILGEIPKVSGGDCTLHGTVAYAPQQPWIVNATVRDNILLGKPYDEEWFKQYARNICSVLWCRFEQSLLFL